MPTQLKELQSLLYRLITAPSGVAEGLVAERSLGAGGLEAIVRGDDRLSAEARVDIYANMYFYRILDALKEDFPATRAVLGGDNFHKAGGKGRGGTKNGGPSHGTGGRRFDQTGPLPR